MSVLIPTYRRLDKLRWCLSSLAAQQTSARFEILIGVDGGEGVPTEEDIPPSLRVCTRVESYAKLGYIAVRHRLLQSARGRVFLSLNDDVHACRDLIERHAHSHSHGPRIFAGGAEWKPAEKPNLFDQLVQQSNLLFFSPPTDRAPTYRDCYGLNMSAPTQPTLEAGGFPDVRNAYGYDDAELAFRLVKSGLPLVLEPQATVLHDHRYTPIDVLRREHLLGRSAWEYAGLHPAFARDLFGRDIRDRGELEHAERYLERERRDALRIQARFLGLAELQPLPPGGDTPRLLATLADSWTILKRFLWRQGLVAASRGEPVAWAPLS